MNNEITLEDKIFQGIEKLKTTVEMEGLVDTDKLIMMAFHIKEDLHILGAQNWILNERRKINEELKLNLKK